jgi:hypothetical protein
MSDNRPTVSENRPTDLLGALPRTRPHRRSDKRGARPSDPATTAAPPETSADGKAARRPAPARKTTAASKTPAARKTTAASKPAAARRPAARKSPAASKSPAAAKSPAASKSPAAAKSPAARRSTAAKAQARERSGRLRQPAQPAGIPTHPRNARRKRAPKAGAEILGTAVQATAELAEIGLVLSARALRNAVSRLPRP